MRVIKSEPCQNLHLIRHITSPNGELASADSELHATGFRLPQESVKISKIIKDIAQELCSLPEHRAGQPDLRRLRNSVLSELC